MSGLRLVSKAGVTKGVTWPLHEGRIVIGRDPNCDIAIADRLVSRRHCEVTIDNGVARIRDLGSRNTTLVNERPITTTGLHDGDEITVGRVILEVRTGPASVEEPARVPDTTRSIRPDDAFFVQSDSRTLAGAGSQAKPKDLAELFALARDLGALESGKALVDAVGAWLARRFHTQALWVGLCADPEAMPTYVYSQNNRAEAPPERYANFVELVRTRGEGLVAPLQAEVRGRVVVESLLCAPLIVGSRLAGLFVLVSSDRVAAYDEADLEFLLAVSAIAAPWLMIHDRLDALDAENRDLKRLAAGHLVLIGQSRPMVRIRNVISKAARSDAPVILLGETGTGKELAARVLHEKSRRRDAPFFVLHCAALNSEQIEAEWFGSDESSTGSLARASGGTLYLDEVGDLSASSQAKLLRLIQEETASQADDSAAPLPRFRIVAACSGDLEEAAHAGQFRPDLYYRLKGFEIALPPLRERRADIRLLAQHFLDIEAARTRARVTGFAPDAIEKLESQAWPGNVRQLRMAIERAVVLAQGETIGADDIVVSVRDATVDLLPLADVERGHIKLVLERCGGRIAPAARILGIGRTTLYEKLQRYGLASK